MLYKDFKVLQDQLIDILIEYAHFLKKGAQLHYKYSSTFKEEILKDFKLRNENTMLITALTMLNEKKTLDDVDNYINGYKKKYQNEFNQLNQRLLAADTICKRKIDAKEKKNLEESFMKFLKKFNPILRLETNSDYNNGYELLQLLYQQDNYQTYLASYEMFINTFSEKNFLGVDFDKYVNEYMNIMQRISLDIENKRKNFPYNKEEVFEDETTIAREMGDFRAKNNILVEANNAIHKDFVLAYGEDVKLY